MENNFQNRVIIFFVGIFLGIVFGYFGDIAENFLAIVLYISAGLCLGGSVFVPLLMALDEKG